VPKFRLGGSWGREKKNSGGAKLVHCWYGGNFQQKKEKKKKKNTTTFQGAGGDFGVVEKDDDTGLFPCPTRGQWRAIRQKRENISDMGEEPSER